jgi:hypothetical protein
MYSFQVFYKVFNDFMSDLKFVFPEQSGAIDGYLQKLNDVPTEDREGEKQVINDVLQPLRRYSRQILINDETMFNMPIVFNETIDLSAMWHTELSDDNQRSFWDYLEKLYIIGNIVLKPKKQDEFLKVVWKIKQKYGGASADAGSSGVAEEVNDDSIQNATEQLQSMFGGNPVLNEMVKDIAQNVGQALKENDPNQMMMSLLSGDHSMFAPLLENMSSKYGERLKNEPINEEELLNQTQNLFKNMPGMGQFMQQSQGQIQQMQAQMAQAQAQMQNLNEIDDDVISPDWGLKYALEAGFTEDDYNRFNETVNVDVDYEKWWDMIRSEFLNKKKWEMDQQMALMGMCEDGLAPALDTIMNQHPEWIKFKKTLPEEAMKVNKN